MHSHKKFTAPLLVPVLVLFSGCGADDWQVETYPVSGTLHVNGEPAAGALVHLHPVETAVDPRNSTPWGKVDSQGQFTLTTYEMNDGAPAGEYQVTLVWPEDASKPSFFDRLGRRFDETQESQWTVHVDAGENVLPAIAVDGVRLIDPKRAGAPSPAL